MRRTATKITNGRQVNQLKWNTKQLTISITSIIFLIGSVTTRVPDEPSISNILLSTVASVTTVPSSIEPPTNPCFYAESDLCTLPRENESCKECIPHPTIPNSLVCCNVTDIERSLSCVPNPPGENSSYWVNVHLRNVTLDELDISNKYWKRLDSLAVTDGQINRITNEFTKFSSPQCINVSSNKLVNIQPRAFKDLVRLQVLDISFNNLTMMPNLNSIQTNLSLDIRGNYAMLCRSVQESIERGGIHFVDPDSTYCLTNQTFNWFNSTDYISLAQLDRIKQLQSECPYIPGYGNCTCVNELMTYEKLHFNYAARVDCSSLGLIELPEKLPMNTLLLNVSNNNISSLSALNENPAYKYLLRFHADDNQISSLLDLEGSDFLEHFDTLSLRRNRLKSIPMYILSNALDKTPDGRQMYLEGNHLHCDCNSAKVLKIWLLAHQSHITDHDKILCENYQMRVVDLIETKLCHSVHDWIDYIFLLITAEVLLLVGLIMKVCYDYWIFRTAGYLPWPANKMPKLPCDWLCEF